MTKNSMTAEEFNDRLTRELTILSAKIQAFEGVPSENIDEAKQSLRQLFLSVIGEDVDLSGDAYGIHEAQNDLRDELRSIINGGKYE